MHAAAVTTAGVIQNAASADAVSTGAVSGTPVSVFAFFTRVAAEMGIWCAVTTSIDHAKCIAAGAGS